MKPLRIVSLLPAATEMAFALGLGDRVVGVSHECDFPAASRERPAVVRPALALEHMSQRQIDAAVSQRLAAGESLYEIDEDLLRELRPDLILTQDLCQVCAPSGRELSAALTALSPSPTVLPMTPHSLADIAANLRELAAATNTAREAAALIMSWDQRLAALEAAAADRRPRVFFMEWVDPIYCSGHWVPEMIELAGGADHLARPGHDSVRLSWQEVLHWDPEVLIVAPCGCDLQRAVAQLPLLTRQAGWPSLAAVRSGRVFAVDANAYFARPGPRVIDGAELLAHLIRPEQFAWRGPVDAYRRL